MNNDELHNETDDLFRKGLNGLPEAVPSPKDWESMQVRMKKEGLIASGTKFRRLLILLLLISVIFVTGSLYVLFKDWASHTNKITFLIKDEQLKSEASSNNRKAITPKFTLSAESSVAAEGRGKAVVSVKDAVKENGALNKKPIVEAKQSNDEEISGNKVKSKTVKKEEAIKALGNMNKENPLPPSRKKNKTKSAGRTEASADVSGESSNPKAQPSNDVIGANLGNSNAENTHADEATQRDSTTNQTNNDDKAPKPDNVPKAFTDSLNTSVPAKAVSLIKAITHRNKLHLGGYFSLDFNNYMVKKTDVVPTAETDVVYNATSINGVSGTSQFTAGITAAYMIDNDVEIETGISYSKKKTVSANITTPAYLNDSSVEAYSRYIYNYNATYLELNAKIKYYFRLADKNWLYIGVGAIAGFNYPGNKDSRGYYDHILYNDSVQVKSDKVTLQPASAIVTAVFVEGFETALKDHWSAFLEPEYKYGLSPVIEHPTFNYIPVNHYLRGFSVGVGIKYGFK